MGGETTQRERQFKKAVLLCRCKTEKLQELNVYKDNILPTNKTASWNLLVPFMADFKTTDSSWMFLRLPILVSSVRQLLLMMLPDDAITPVSWPQRSFSGASSAKCR